MYSKLEAQRKGYKRARNERIIWIWREHSKTAKFLENHGILKQIEFIGLIYQFIKRGHPGGYSDDCKCICHDITGGYHYD